MGWGYGVGLIRLGPQTHGARHPTQTHPHPPATPHPNPAGHHALRAAALHGPVAELDTYTPTALTRKPQALHHNPSTPTHPPPTRAGHHALRAAAARAGGRARHHRPPLCALHQAQRAAGAQQARARRHAAPAAVRCFAPLAIGGAGGRHGIRGACAGPGRVRVLLSSVFVCGGCCWGCTSCGAVPLTGGEAGGARDTDTWGAGRGGGPSTGAGTRSRVGAAPAPAAVRCAVGSGCMMQSLLLQQTVGCRAPTAAAAASHPLDPRMAHALTEEGTPPAALHRAPGRAP